MENLYNIQKDLRVAFFIINALNFYNEHPCICSISGFLEIISTSAKIVYLYDTAGQKGIKLK